MYKFLKHNYVLIFLLIIIGLVSFVPQIVSIYKMGDNFKGIYPVNGGDDNYYYARIKDVIDGHTFLSNPYLYEHKNGSPMQFWLPDLILSIPINILNLPVPLGVMLYDLILPPILALLLYLILMQLTRSKIISVNGVIFLNIYYFLDLFNRSPSPQLNFIFWLLSVLFLFKYIESENKKFLIPATLSFGLLFYTYTYFWTFLFALICIYIVINILLKKLVDYKYLLLYLFFGVAIGSFYFFQIYMSMQLPYYNESLQRLGMINTHFPSGIFIVGMSSLALIAHGFVYKFNLIEDLKINLFLISCLIANIILVNQHIITGKNLEFSSHYHLTAVYSVMFSLFYLLHIVLKHSFMKKFKKLTFFTLSFFIATISFFSMTNVIYAQAEPRDYEIKWQKYGEAINWLNENTPKESVVFADDEVSQLIPIYTNNNVFYTRPANFFFISDYEVFERFILNNYYENIDKEFLLQNIRSVWGVYYEDKYNHEQSKNKILMLIGLMTKNNQLIPDEAYNAVLELSAELKMQDLLIKLSKYRVDYFLINKSSNRNWKLSNQYIKMVYEDNYVIIYEK